jgi:DNA replication and repair protein RecF
MLQTHLEPWNIQLINKGSSIIYKRAKVLERFIDYLAIQYQTITGLSLKPSLRYQSISNKLGSEEEIREEYTRQIENSIEKEAEREQTLIGPHRDEIVFYLGDMELRNYGSQGQHRLFSMALKMGQLFYYLDELDDLPILLLDDLFGNLDQQKIDIITETLTKHSGQTFITSASERPFDKRQYQNIDDNRWFTVLESNVKQKY